MSVTFAFDVDGMALSVRNLTKC